MSRCNRRLHGYPWSCFEPKLSRSSARKNRMPERIQSKCWRECKRECRENCHLECRRTFQIEPQNVCQIECQNTGLTECQNISGQSCTKSSAVICSAFFGKKRKQPTLKCKRGNFSFGVLLRCETWTHCSGQSAQNLFPRDQTHIVLTCQIEHPNGI